MNKYRYSPHAISEYKLVSMPLCEISVIMDLPADEQLSIWNLSYLSLPDLDILPIRGKRPDWFRYYAPTLGASRVIFTDVYSDDVMALKLRMHPVAFMEWFEREDHSNLFACYGELNGEAWVRTVMARAAATAQRMALDVPELRRDNIYSIHGGRRVA